VSPLSPRSSARSGSGSKPSGMGWDAEYRSSGDGPGADYRSLRDRSTGHPGMVRGPTTVLRGMVYRSLGDGFVTQVMTWIELWLP
jgi:hypothetical protein